MKKLLLSFAVIAMGFASNAQVVVSGVSPTAVQGNYNFEWADPPGGWGTPDFLIPGTFVEDTLMFVDDGSTGNNTTYGHPLAQQACNPLVNNLTSFIAVIYRGDCEFGSKALAAENAGAVAVIIINHTGDAVGMAPGADGANVTIPVVMVGEVDGANIVSEMANGPVVMFIGNKVGAYANDIGANSGEMLVSPYGGANSRQFDGFSLGIQLYNFGSNDQASVDVTATIDGPAGNYYTETVNIQNMSSGDTASIFDGNPLAFTPWTEGGIGNYDNGLYTLTYTLDFGGADDSDFDNVLSSTFTIQDNVLSLSNLDGAGMPVANNYPSNAVSDYRSCMMVQEPNASTLGIQGMYLVPTADLTLGSLAGAEIFGWAYSWDDPWVDLDDAIFGTAGAGFDNLNVLTYGTHYPASDNEAEQPAYLSFETPLVLQDNVRYLFCLEVNGNGVDDIPVSFGYDNLIDYDGNQGIFRQPISPVIVDGQGFTGGWAGVSAPSIALNVFDPAELGLEENTIGGSAFPNPANDKVNVSLNAEGDAMLTVADVTGKIAFAAPITLVNGTASVDISALASGVYTFNVALESGETTSFNVMKK